jgi:hypothetical protein
MAQRDVSGSRGIWAATDGCKRGSCSQHHATMLEASSPSGSGELLGLVGCAEGGLNEGPLASVGPRWVEASSIALAPDPGGLVATWDQARLRISGRTRPVSLSL